MKKIGMLLIMLITASGFGMAFAQSAGSMTEKSTSMQTDKKPGWKELGEKKVSLKTGHDELVVTDSTRVTAIKVKARDEGLTLTDVHVFYNSGATQNISLNTLIKPNGESREIDLAGNSKSIKKIEFDYKSPEGATAMKDENATIVVMGLLANTETPKKY